MSSVIATPTFTWSDDLETIHQRGLWADAWERFRRNRLALVAVGVIIFMVLVSIVGPLLSPWPDTLQDLKNVSQPPSAAHWFGTDSLGRDYLTRIMMGGRTAFSVALFVVLIRTIIGVVMGAASAYYGGWIDTIVMRITDMLLSFPELLLAMFLVGTVRNPVVDALTNLYVQTRNPLFKSTGFVDYTLVLGTLAIVGWSGIARLIRGQVLSLSQKEFIEAERAMGATARMIVKDHLIPNALGPVVVAVSAGFGSVMLLESSLSFLGLGIEPPGASWGNMINENLVTWRYQPHLLAVPGLVLAITILAANFLGDGVNDALNPRQGQRR
jgi:ABC-type dipeptide/oligopeptide/nickel transport system permease subunit